jgi:hypothetical protein
VLRKVADAPLPDFPWGFPPPPNLGKVPVTNGRNPKSSCLCGWLTECKTISTTWEYRRQHSNVQITKLTGKAPDHLIQKMLRIDDP